MSDLPSSPRFRLRDLLTIAMVVTLVIGLAPHPRARFWCTALHARVSGKRIDNNKHLPPAARRERESLFADSSSFRVSGDRISAATFRGFDAGSSPRAPPLTLI